MLWTTPPKSDVWGQLEAGPEHANSGDLGLSLAEADPEVSRGPRDNDPLPALPVVLRVEARAVTDPVVAGGRHERPHAVEVIPVEVSRRVDIHLLKKHLDGRPQGWDECVANSLR